MISSPVHFSTTDRPGQQPDSEVGLHKATRILPEDPQRLHFYTWVPQQPLLGPPWAPLKPREARATSKQCSHFQQGGATATQLSRVNVTALQGKTSSTEVFQLHSGRGRFPQCKNNSSAPRGILVIGSPGTPQSHTTQQTSHGKEKSHVRKVADSRWVRRNSKLSGKQTL